MREALVVGGGIAGASLALQLARAGRDVALVERTTAPHDKVCGEFLSAEAVAMLDELGVDVRALGATAIDRVGLNAGCRRIEHRLPFQAMSLSRRVLDEVLINAAHAAGARVLRGQAVRRVSGGTGDWRVQVGDEALPAGALFIASGKHDVRGRARPPGRQPGFVGMKLHLDAPSAGVELVLFGGGYAGVEPVEGERSNLCLLIHRDRLARLGGGWPGVADHLRRESPLLRDLLAGRATDARPLTIANIPYGFVRRDTDGAFHLGDQAAVIPSFTGDGMSIALFSARMAAAAWLGGETAATYQARLADAVGAQVARAIWMSRALVHPVTRALAVAAAAIVPSGLSFAARITRIPDAALARQGVRAHAGLQGGDAS